MIKKYLLLTLFSALYFSSQINAQCTPPTLEVGGTAIVCNNNSATLTATTNGQEVRWYDAEVGGTQLGTGTTFETEPVTGTTSFWGEALFLGSDPGTGGGGKLSPSSNSSSTVNAGTAPWGLAFTATQSFIINSVDVFLSSGTAGTVVILLKDSNYATLETLNIAVPEGGTASNPVQYTLPLNISVTPGDYKLVVESGPAMIRDLSSGNFFPYAIGTVGSVTGGTINDSTTNSGVYYFLYNWNFSTLGGEECISEREEFVVTTTPSPETPDNVELIVCVGTTIADTAIETETLNWYLSETAITPLSNTVVLQNNTTYYIAETNTECESGRATVTVTTTEPPEAPEAFAQDFCGEAIVAELTAEGETTLWYDTETGGEPLTDETVVISGAYYVSQIENNCESERTMVEVNVYDIPDAPEGNEEQEFDEGETLADLIVTGENLMWFADAAMQNPLPNTTELVDETTYYVTQMVNGCMSEPLAITVNAALGIENIVFNGLKVYPNPTSGIVSISNTTVISNISVYTLLGQKVYEKNNTAQKADINLSGLAAGTYLLKLQAGDAVKTIKIVKE